ELGFAEIPERANSNGAFSPVLGRAPQSPAGASSSMRKNAATAHARAVLSAHNHCRTGKPSEEVEHIRLLPQCARITEQLQDIGIVHPPLVLRDGSFHVVHEDVSLVSVHD